MTRKLFIQDLSLQGKRVLIRVDFNVPINKNATIGDDSRILAALSSIRYVLNAGGSLVLMSHLGRPKGKDPKLSLAPVAKHLSDILDIPVQMAPDCVGSEVERMARALKPGEVLLLENLRFHEGEEYPDKDPSFAANLAKLADVYVNDAFGTAHRAHSSTTTITKYFPEKAAAGFLLQMEMQYLGELFTEPTRPFYALVGGAKISSKIGTLKVLLKKVDALFIGGAMAFTFFKAKGIPIGTSLHEDDCIDAAREIMSLCQQHHKKLYLPVDIVVVPELNAQVTADRVVMMDQGIPDGLMGVDIGPKTVQAYTEGLSAAATIFWNGPMGVFEVEPFAKGTYAIAKILAGLKAQTVVGGGDSLAALQQIGLVNKMAHVSTGGGAVLEYIEQGSLPGIDALSDAPLRPFKGVPI